MIFYIPEISAGRLFVLAGASSASRPPWVSPTCLSQQLRGQRLSGHTAHRPGPRSLIIEIQILTTDNSEVLAILGFLGSLRRLAQKIFSYKSLSNYVHLYGGTLG